MPRLSDSMEEGTVLRWLKIVGDEVKRGDELVEIETDKANMIYEATDEGTLIEIVAQEGDTLPIGDVIARIGEAGEVKGDGAAGGAEGRGKEAPAEPNRSRDGAEPETRPSASPRRRERQPRSAPAAASEDGRVKASPVARRMAGELGVELAAIQGSGPGGRIVKADVEAAARPRRTAPPAAGAAQSRRRREAPRAARRRPAQAPSSRDRQGRGRGRRAQPAPADGRPPHVGVEGDRPALLSPDGDRHVGGGQDARRSSSRSSRRAGPRRPSTTWSSRRARSPCASSRARTAPTATARSSSTRASTSAIAVAAQDALVVPTIFDADRKSLGEIAVEARQLAGKVRDGTDHAARALRRDVHRLQPRHVRGRQLLRGDQSAAGGAARGRRGRGRSRSSTSTSGAIVARQLMGVTLACDHRILYGADGAQFLGRVRDLLQQPLSLSL